MIEIIAAADGSALGNPGPAGWAWYIDENTWAAGGWEHGTNNMGEIKGVLDLFESTANLPEHRLKVLCDSQYVINSVTKWMAGWKKKGWKKSDGKPVLNRELWEQLDAAIAGRNYEFSWVKGHSGHELNEAADSRANAAAQAYKAGQEPEAGPGLSEAFVRSVGLEPQGAEEMTPEAQETLEKAQEPGMEAEEVLETPTASAPESTPEDATLSTHDYSEDEISAARRNLDALRASGLLGSGAKIAVPDEQEVRERKAKFAELEEQRAKAEGQAAARAEDELEAKTIQANEEEISDLPQGDDGDYDPLEELYAEDETQQAEQGEPQAVEPAQQPAHAHESASIGESAPAEEGAHSSRILPPPAQDDMEPLGPWDDELHDNAPQGAPSQIAVSQAAPAQSQLVQPQQNIDPWADTQAAAPQALGVPAPNPDDAVRADMYLAQHGTSLDDNTLTALLHERLVWATVAGKTVTRASALAYRSAAFAQVGAPIKHSAQRVDESNVLVFAQIQVPGRGTVNRSSLWHYDAANARWSLRFRQDTLVPAA